MTAPDVTIGELARTLDRLDSRMSAQFQAVNQRLDNLQFVSRDTYRVEMDTVKADVSDLKEDKTWNRRAVVGLFILPFITSLAAAWATVAL